MAPVDRANESGSGVRDLRADFAIALGLARGVTGYVYHTVPVAVYAWLRHYGDFRATVEAALDCGGDTDTVGAIAGALAGGTVVGRGSPPRGSTELSTGPGRCDYFAGSPIGLPNNSTREVRLARFPISGRPSCRETSSSF